jgi:hypothetical protein
LKKENKDLEGRQGCQGAAERERGSTCRESRETRWLDKGQRHKTQGPQKANQGGLLATHAGSLGTSLPHAQTMLGRCVATRAGSTGTWARSTQQQERRAMEVQGPSSQRGLRDEPSTPQKWGHGSPTTSHRERMSSSTA